MKECIVLAGGFGTRLQSVVKDVPKCMAEVAGQPFLYYLFKYLAKQKVNHVILSLGYKADVVTDWLSKNKYPFEVSYVIESEPLGTGGAIKYAMTHTQSKSVFVINGDTYFDVDFDNFQSFHQTNGADISLSLKELKEFDRYGSVELHNSTIVGFNEKSYCKQGYINGGIYLIDVDFITGQPLPDRFSFEKDILENKDNKLNKAIILGYKSNGYFIDIGIPEDFAKANTDFLNFEND